MKLRILVSVFSDCLPNFHEDFSSSCSHSTLDLPANEWWPIWELRLDGADQTACVVSRIDHQELGPRLECLPVGHAGSFRLFLQAEHVVIVRCDSSRFVTHIRRHER
jgi:hypothetical protein